jgi:YfiH family protein
MMLDYIVPNWPAPKNIKCVTTTRTGGYSKQEYHSLNLGSHVKDDKESVLQNRHLILEDLKLPSEPIWLEQVHGSFVLNLAENSPMDNVADAMYSNKVGDVCAVLTADCLPVAFCDLSGEHISVAHAGWRGLENGVLENTLHTMPVVNEKIICWLGPAIGPDSFEVGEEVFERFISKNKTHKNSFIKKNNRKYLANIYQLAKNILASHKVQGIYGSGYCTYNEYDRFYSYRRDGETGRMATLIWKDE